MHDGYNVMKEKEDLYLKEFLLFNNFKIKILQY